MLNQHDNIEQSALGVRLARSTFQPKVVPDDARIVRPAPTINSQTYRVDVSQKFVTGTEMRFGIGTSTSQIPGEPGVPATDIHFCNADTTLTLSQPLLRGFERASRGARLTSAELRRGDADRQQTLTEQQVALEVASAYYRVVAQQTIADVARKVSTARGGCVTPPKPSSTPALVSQLDVLRAQQLVSQAEIRSCSTRSRRLTTRAII